MLDAAVVRLVVGGGVAAGDGVPRPAEAGPVALGAVGFVCADDCPVVALIVVDGPAGVGSSEPGAVGAGVTAEESGAARMDASVGVVEECRVVDAVADGRVAAVAEGAAPDLSVGAVVEESTAVVVEAGVLGGTPGPAAPADGVAGAIGWSAVSGALTGAPLVAEAGVLAVAGGAETPQQNTATVVAAAPTGRSHE